MWCSRCNTIEACPYHRKAFLQFEDQIPYITPESVAKARPVVAAMKKLIDMYDKTEKALLDKYGSIPLGEGHELIYTQRNDKIYDAPKTIAVLSAQFAVTNDVLGPALSINKKGIEGIAEKIAPARGKGKTLKAIVQALEENDAIRTKITPVRTVRR